MRLTERFCGNTYDSNSGLFVINRKLLKKNRRDFLTLHIDTNDIVNEKKTFIMLGDCIWNKLYTL